MLGFETPKWSSVIGIWSFRFVEELEFIIWDLDRTVPRGVKGHNRK